MTDEAVLRVEFREKGRMALRLKATTFEADPGDSEWLQFKSADGTVLKSRVNRQDVSQVVDESEEAEPDIGF